MFWKYGRAKHLNNEENAMLKEMVIAAVLVLSPALAAALGASSAIAADYREYIVA
jgi:hypothetical protein